MATRELCVMADSNVQDETHSRVAAILHDVLSFGSRPSDHYFRSVCWFVCLSVCLFVCLCRVFLSCL